MNMYTCSNCNGIGHNKRNKNCPVNRVIQETQGTPIQSIKTTVPELVTTYKKPVIIYDNIHSIYFSIVKEQYLTPYVISICMKNNTARWCYTRGDHKYMVSNNGADRPNKNNIHIAFIIPRPTNAVLSILIWDLIYIPPTTVRSSSCECPICYEKIISNKLVKMSCEHSFCLQCIQGCITSIQTTEQIFVCPMCRQQSNSITLSNPTIYNTIANTLYKL